LSWLEDSNALLQACLPLLSPDGILILSALGPDSLKELEATHSATIVPMRIDMHEVGDQLLHIGFKDPVLDVEHYTFSYKEPEKLHAELIASGMLMSHAAQPMLTEVTYEVFYAHAFGPPQTESFAAQAGNVNIPLQYLRNQLRNKNS
jgi:malonyl-CoA O-methyltransferase